MTEEEYAEGIERHAETILALVQELKTEHGMSSGEAVVQAMASMVAIAHFEIERLTHAHNTLVMSTAATQAAKVLKMERPKGFFARLFGR